MVSEDGLQSLFDFYSVKIISMAMQRPITVQEVSEELEIPSATCYRKVNELVEKGVLTEVQKKLVEKQKRRSAYISLIKEVKMEITSEGIKLDWKYYDKPVEMWESIKKYNL
ncbi:MAG: winged helix-turn-helix domain-containing protein [Archaeoglobaceae archaeon]